MGEEMKLHEHRRVKYFPAQESYMQVRKSIGKVAVDQVLFDFLQYGIMWTDLGAVGEKEFQVLNKTIQVSSRLGQISEVHLGYNLYSASGKSARRKRMPTEAQAIQNREFKIRLYKTLQGSLEHTHSNLLRLELNGVELCKSSSTCLGRGLAFTPSLRFFSIANSMCGDEIFSHIASGLEKNRSIQDLVLRGCCLSDKSGGSIANIIAAHSNRRSDEKWVISLRRTAFSEESMSLLSPEELNEVALHGLLLVDLAQNDLGNDTAEMLSRVIIADEWLGGVNLKQNRVGHEGVESFLRAIEDSNDSLAVLDLRENRSDCEITVKCIQSLNLLLRERSESGKHGLLSRYLPLSLKCVDGDGTNGQFASSTIASGILRWGSGHQLSKSVAGVVASLATQNTEYVNVEMDSVKVDIEDILEEDEVLLPTAIKERRKQKFEQRLVREKRAELSRRNTKPELQSTENRFKSSNNRGTLTVNLYSGEEEVGIPTLPQRKETPRPTVHGKQSKMKKCGKSSKRAARSPKVVGKEKEKLTGIASSAGKANQIAEAFRVQLDKLLESYTNEVQVGKQLAKSYDSPTAVRRTPEKSQPLRVLEESVQQLNKVLNQLSFGTPQAESGSFDVFQHDRVVEDSEDKDDLNSALPNVPEELSSEVARRLARKWKIEQDELD